MIRIGPQLTIAAFFAVSVASADPVPECAVNATASEPVATIQLESGENGAEARTPETSTAPTETETGEAEATARTAQAERDGAAAAQAERVAPRSTARRWQVWARNVRGMLSLREFIQTTPLVVAGMKVYLEAEPVAVMQRPHSASQLTFAVAPDKIVLRGAF